MTKTKARYEVVKTGYDIECEHPLCYPLHRKWMTRGDHEFLVHGFGWTNMVHTIHRTLWGVMDTATGDWALMGEWFETRREAVEAMAGITD